MRAEEEDLSEGEATVAEDVSGPSAHFLSQKSEVSEQNHKKSVFSEISAEVKENEPSKPAEEWASVLFDQLPVHLRLWILRFEPTMRCTWSTMAVEGRQMLPVLSHFAKQFPAEQRRAMVTRLFEDRGFWRQGDKAWQGLFHGLPDTFGHIQFGAHEDMTAARVVMSIADCYLSLIDEGGFSESIEWSPTPVVRDPEHFKAGGVHAPSAQAAWHRLHESGPGVSKWVLEWIDNRVWFSKNQPHVVDHSAVNASCFSPSSRQYDEEKVAFMDSKIKEMLRVGAAIKLAPGAPPDVLTRLSLAPKPGKGDKWRVIMDMRPENTKYDKKRVRMEHLAHVPTVFSGNELMWSIDMKSAYYSVGIDPRLGRTMGFEWQGTYYRFTTLCFGFVLAPYVFTKVGRQMLKKWRAVGPSNWYGRCAQYGDYRLQPQLRSMLYIDDGLAGHNLFGAAVWLRNAQMLEIESLGFSLSAKGELLPFPLQRFLGMLIHFGQKIPSWHLPSDKLQSLMQVATDLQQQAAVGEVPCQQAARCIGKLVSASRAVPIAKLLFRELNRAIYSKGSPDWKGKVTVSTEARQDLAWILQCFSHLNQSGSPIWIESRIERVDYVLVQDAGPRAIGLALHAADELFAPAVDPLPTDNSFLTGQGHCAKVTALGTGLDVVLAGQENRVTELVTSNTGSDDKIVGWDSHAAGSTVALSGAESSLSTALREKAALPDIGHSSSGKLSAEQVMSGLSVATSEGTIELTDDECNHHHVHKELLGVLLALQSRRVQLQHRRVCVFVDSTATVAYLVNWGGPSVIMMKMVRQIWAVCASWDIRIVQVSHIKGDRMITAGVDALSRPYRFARGGEADRDEWRLKDVAFEWLQSVVLSVFDRQVTIDRMASRANRRVVRFNSVCSIDPDAESFSAFASDWQSEVNYCFPPFGLIPRVLQHVTECQAIAAVVVPDWPSQSWWLDLQALAVYTVPFPFQSVFERVKDGQWQDVPHKSFRPLLVLLDGCICSTRGTSVPK